MVFVALSPCAAPLAGFFWRLDAFLVSLGSSGKLPGLWPLQEQREVAQCAAMPLPLQGLKKQQARTKRWQQ